MSCVRWGSGGSPRRSSTTSVTVVLFYGPPARTSPLANNAEPFGRSPTARRRKVLLGPRRNPPRHQGRDKEESHMGRWAKETAIQRSSLVSIVAAVVLVAVLLPSGSVQAKKTCSPREQAGGDWPFYGRDV